MLHDVLEDYAVDAYQGTLILRLNIVLLWGSERSVSDGTLYFDV